jgi:hypothetical protein
MSERTLAAPWFLVTTAIVTGLVTALISWLAVDSPDGVRLLAVLIGVAVGLGVMLLVAWAVSEEGEGPTVTMPAAEPVVTVPPRPVAGPSDVDAHLESGRALLQELEPGTPDARVDSWIAGVRKTLEQQRPGLLGYYDALGARQYADDRNRLDTHVSRLATIARDFF